MIADKKNKGVFFMAYPLLNKLYYQDQSRYAQVYQDRFQSEDAVKLDFSIGDRQAFFVQTGDLWRRGFQILRLNGQVTALSSALPPIARQQGAPRITAPHVPIGSNAGEPNNIPMQTAILKESLEWVRDCPSYNGLKVLPYEYRHNV